MDKTIGRVCHSPGAVGLAASEWRLCRSNQSNRVEDNFYESDRQPIDMIDCVALGA